MVLETSGGYTFLKREINSVDIKHKFSFSTKMSCKEKKRLADVMLSMNT